jgi:hypothetical protein
MKLLPILNEIKEKELFELDGQFKEETEILYKDKNIVCLVPKSQMISKIFGKGTNWCTTQKQGFEMWGRHGLFIRFLFRGGRKIRVTYLFKSNLYNWANENGYHTLEGSGNPFTPEIKNTGFSNEMDVFEHIKKIPKECKKAVLDFIKKHKKGYEYCFRDEEYLTKKEIEMDIKLKKLKNIVYKYMEAVIDSFDLRPKILINYLYHEKKQTWEIFYNDNLTGKGEKVAKFFDDFEDAEKYLLNICQDSYNKHTKYFQPKTDFK